MDEIKGPWTVELGMRTIQVHTNTGRRLVIGGNEEAEAVARLIAQAPAMAEALEAFVAACETAPPVDLITHIGAACEKAKAVLTAIKGE